MYQALSRFTVLQATGSWARVWEQGYFYLRSKYLISFDWVEDETILSNTLVNELPGREEEYIPTSFMEWSPTNVIHGIHITFVVFNQYPDQLKVASATWE